MGYGYRLWIPRMYGFPLTIHLLAPEASGVCEACTKMGAPRSKGDDPWQ